MALRLIVIIILKCALFHVLRLFTLYFASIYYQGYIALDVEYSVLDLVKEFNPNIWQNMLLTLLQLRVIIFHCKDCYYGKLFLKP